MSPRFSGTDPFTVVVFEAEPELSPDVAEWCGDQNEVRSAHDVEEMVARLDSSVDSVIIGLDYATPEIAEWVRSLPYFGPLAMVVDNPRFDRDTVPANFYLHEPLSADRVHTALDTMLTYARGDQFNLELLGLLSDKAQFERDRTEPELSTNLRYQTVLEEIEALRERLDPEITTVSSKHRPTRCSHCKLRWDLSVDGTVGFIPMGSFSWRCVRCDETTTGVNPFDRSVARR